MGSSPSKVDKGFEGQSNNPVDTLSFDQSIVYTKDPSHQEEKKEMETVSTLAATPRRKHQRVSSEKKGSELAPERRDDMPRQSRITDDQVHVNLAMADLMAYLQVVANNSNKLPLTRRDDPEIDCMVSNLTSEEYARKSAAFIPADVRVIGGSFTKYGRVWDLPTSDEYNAQDGAQEPGRSYGGACCNAMLKVLYDAANEAVDAAPTTENSDGLFDDDDDEEATLSGTPAFTANRSFASLDMNDHSNPTTISWAALMKKMKSEMKDIEYAQVPKLTTTRKMDLSQAFSLVPESFDPKTCKRRSLLIGCNYNHLSGAQLKASHDDVRSMKDYIVNVHGFPESDDMMTILLDDDDHQHPTFLNITEALKALSEESQPGDAVFVHFAGHGGRVLDSNDDAEGGSYDEVVVPSDYTTSGLIRDTLLFKTLLAPMRYGVTVTILTDACDTGMVLDLPYAWSARSDRSGSTSKLSQNENFSFVRFLKVVKTLYESSTFTQLGKTVGSALTTGNAQIYTEDEDETDDISRDSRTDDDKTNNHLQTRNNGIFSMFFGASTAEPAEENKPQKSRKKAHDEITYDSRDTQNISIFEKMINCTLGEEVELDDMSDFDSFGNNAPTFSDRDEDDFTETSCDERYEESGRRRGSRSDRGRSRGRRK